MAISRNNYRNASFARLFEGKWGLGITLSLLVSAYSGGVAAEANCDAEIALLSGEVSSREASSNTGVERASQLLKVLVEDCNAGASLESVKSLSNMIREELGLEVRS